MKKRLIALVLIAALLAGLFAACAEPPEPLATGPMEEPPPPDIVTLGKAEDTNAAILNFSHALFREVLAMEEENPVISPLSAYYVLAMAALGAEGETRAEFEAVLGRPAAALAGELYALTQSLTDTAGSTELNIAGSIWTNEPLAIHPAFAEAMRVYFDAPALSRNFALPETLDEINAWVSERTEGLIDRFLSELDPALFMMLINTLYFSGQWAEVFRPMTEFPDMFHPERGSSVEVLFLSTGGTDLAASITDTYEAVMLPYDDGRLGFLLVRPTDGTPVREFAAAQDLRMIVAGLEMQRLGTTIARTGEQVEVVVRMPKLDLEFGIFLTEILQNMGLQAAFIPAQAAFPGLLEGDPPLWIDLVFQRVRLIVDEEGTEAAAATGIFVAGAAPRPMDFITLTFDTPYLYAIYDLEAGIPLFIGVLENPA